MIFRINIILIGVTFSQLATDRQDQRCKMRPNRNLLLSITIAIISLLMVHAQEGSLFKINKLNLIWHKAQHSLGPSKLKDLKNDLTKHESDELSVKKMKAHNQDKDGLFEAAVRKKLLSIMKKYSLERYYDDVHPVDGMNTEVKETHPDNPQIRNFRDSKLDKLWKKAEKSGFTQEQLMVLHEEFQHQQDKLDEHYETMNMIEEEVEKRAKEKERAENSIDDTTDDGHRRKGTKEKEADKKARMSENAHQTLKEKHSDIKKGYDKLQKKIVDKVVDENSPFKEEPVNKLWNEALQMSFSKDELQSFKEELDNYQTRIEKLKHFQNQLERKKLHRTDDPTVDDEDSDDTETKHIKKRAKELKHKVDKTHRSLEKKLNLARREEL